MSERRRPVSIDRILVASIAVISLLACQPADDAPESVTDRPAVALIMKSLANEFFTRMADGARAHQADHADTYELVVNGIKDESDLAQQVALVEQMIARRVDAHRHRTGRLQGAGARSAARRCCGNRRRQHRQQTG